MDEFVGHLKVLTLNCPILYPPAGIYFIDRCPAEPNIPVFLVVGGVSGALKNIALVLENIVKRTSHRFSVESARRLRYAKFTWRGVNLIFDLFLMAWIIAGSYWIYHIYREVDPDFDECHETLYKFAFGVITSSYILFAMMCCCMCVCGVCLLPRHSEEEEEEEGGEGSRRGSHSPTPHSDLENSPQPGETATDEGNVSSENGETVGLHSEEEYGERGRGEREEQGGTVGGEREGRERGVDMEPIIGGRRQLPQQDLTLDNLEPLNVGEYEQTPVLSPRARQLVTNEQGHPLSPKTTSV